MKSAQIALDIETIPDLELARELHVELRDIQDDRECAAMLAELRGRGSNKFLPPIYHKICTASVGIREKVSADGLLEFSISSLGRSDVLDEVKILKDFDYALSRQQARPTLITFNGYSFDMAVIRYRAMRLGTPLTTYWDVGQDGDKERLYGNYFNRYHWEHVDLKDVLADYQYGSSCRLEELAVSIGLPGKIGIGGAQVFDAYLDGKLQEIKDYCDIDVLITYLCWLRWEQTRGLSRARFFARVYEVLDFVESRAHVGHYQAFLANWKIEQYQWVE